MTEAEMTCEAPQLGLIANGAINRLLTLKALPELEHLSHQINRNLELLREELSRHEHEQQPNHPTI